MSSSTWFLFIIVLTIFAVLATKKPKRHKKSPIRQQNKGSYLQLVANAHWSKQKLMNKSEYTVFRRLENLLVKRHQGQCFRLFSQVSMGEFITSSYDKAYNCINCKRVDFLIINQLGEPIVVIEYQGEKHYQNNAVERDAIKKEACRKAGIAYLEFKPNYDSLDIERVSKILTDEHTRLINKDKKC